MSNPLDKAGRAASDAAKNLRDETSEKVHEAKASAEKLRRETEDLSVSDTVKFVANEAKERVQASIDHAKHETRKRTG